MSLINDALKRAKSAQKRPESTLAEDPGMQPVEEAPKEAQERKSSPLIIPLAVILVGLAGYFLWQWWSSQSAATQTVALNNKLTVPPTNSAKPSNVLTRMTSTITNAFAPQDTSVVTPTPAATNVVTQANAPAKPEAAAATNPTNSVSQSPIPVAGTAQAKPATPSQAESNTVAARSESAQTSAPTKSAATKESVIESVANASAPKNVTFPQVKLQAIYYRLSKPSALINNKTMHVGDVIDGAKITKIERQSVRLELHGKTKDLLLK